MPTPSHTLLRTPLLLLAFAMLGCGSDQPPVVLSESITQQSLPEQWYAGKGEISVYQLEQNRYNALHPGKMTTIFVTEPFLTDLQVKNDSGKAQNSVSALKMNKIRRFTTGLYDYSLYTSVFTDAKKAKTYKVTTSAQDWCGQSYMQLNRRKDKYKVEVRSYFENEGDQSSTVEAVVLEDELPIYIRLNPDLLPTGTFILLPSQEYARLRHVDFDPMKASGTLTEQPGSANSPGIMTYTVSIPEAQRTLTYTFTKNELRPITQWTDSYPSAFDGKVRTTRATLTHSEWLPYWSLNSAPDAAIRSGFELKDF